MEYRLELEDREHNSQYMLNSATEIGFLLKTLSEQSAMVMVYFNHNQSFFMTTLLGLDTARGKLYLEFSNNADVNRQAVTARDFTCATSLERVKIQFAVSGVEQATFQGRPVFQCNMPKQLLRLQRRESYRVPTPAVRPLKCAMLVNDDFGNARQLEVPLLDISAGGVGLMLTQAQVPLFTKGRVYSGCRMDLPEEGAFTCNLRLCEFIDVTGRNGNSYTRVGCEFVELRGAIETMIQRYIIRLERERKARSSGLA